MTLLFRYLFVLFSFFLCWMPHLRAQTQKKDSAVIKTVGISQNPQALHESFQQIYTSEPRKALRLAQQALSLASKEKDELWQAHALSDMGVANDILGNYSTAMKLYVQALELFEKLNLLKERAITLSHIGIIHRRQHNPLKALEIYMKTLEIHNQLADTRGIAVAHNNMGNAYKDMNHFTNAIREFELALNIFDSLNLKKEQSYVQNNMGELLLLTGKTREATLMLNRSLNTKKELNDHYGLAVTMNNLAKLHLKQGKYDRALSFAKNSLKKAEELQIKQEVMHAAQTIANIYAKMGNYQQAYAYEQLHSITQDSIFDEISLKQINQMQTNYDLAKKESEIELLTKNTIIQEKEDKIQKQWIGMLLGGVAALIGIVSTLIWYSQRLRKKSNLLVKQNENVKLAQENAHQLSELGKHITSLLTVKDIAKADYSRLSELLPADVVGIGIYQEEYQALVFDDVIELGRRLQRMEVPIKDPSKLSTWCYNHKKEILINDIDQEYQNYIEQRPQMIGASQETSSIIYVPLIGSKTNLGVLTIQSFKANAYSQYHLDIAKNFALYTAIALENAQAFQELRDAVDKLINAQEELLQARKMASIGELTKGIAHELNNPINFVLNGTELLHSRVQELQELAKAYTKLETGIPSDQLFEIKRFKELIEFDFMQNDLDTLLEDIKEGARRSASIVKGLQIFSMPDTGELKYTDIHSGLDDALSLLGNQIRYKDIQVIKDYEDTGNVYLNPVEVNQVFVNLLTNAIQSVNGEGKIAIQTRLLGEQVKISVKDNGCGIPEELQEKIFDPFFTTRDAGEGTGLGLSIVYSIIKKHHGKVEVYSQVGEGSEFVIWLPKDQPENE
ncbi:MAG: tetratricopeptide repeat protein [Flammeovirgaceae bacterium]